MIYLAMGKHFPSRIQIPQPGKRVDYLLCSPTLCKVANIIWLAPSLITSQYLKPRWGVWPHANASTTKHWPSSNGRCILCRFVEVCLSSPYTHALHNGLTFLASALKTSHSWSSPYAIWCKHRTDVRILSLCAKTCLLPAQSVTPSSLRCRLIAICWIQQEHRHILPLSPIRRKCCCTLT